MNRRAFLQRGSFAAVAAAGLPLAVKAKNKKSPIENVGYRTTDNQQAGQVIYGMSVDHEGITSFESAEDEEKLITMVAKKYASTAREAPQRWAEFKLTIQKVKAIKNLDEVYEVEVKVEKVSGDFSLPKDIAKKMKLRCNTYEYINILGKKNEVLAELPHTKPSSDDEDCFLTTACVHHKNLQDNCEELQTLRSLRDNFMRKQDAGVALIDQYCIVGPEIVHAINALQNSHEVYDYMYSQMILPSVELVKNGRPDEAVEYYKTFVAALHRRYC